MYHNQTEHAPQLISLAMMYTFKQLKALYVAYESVRKSGNYNMLTEAGAARDEAGLTVEEYYYVINNYSDLQSL